MSIVAVKRKWSESNRFELNLLIFLGELLYLPTPVFKLAYIIMLDAAFKIKLLALGYAVLLYSESEDKEIVSKHLFLLIAHSSKTGYLDPRKNSF